MRNIIVVDAISTGYNYVEDIVRRGYQPVVLNSKQSEEGIVGALADYVVYAHKPLVIKELESYEETLKMVKGYDPVLVLPGSEGGVELATRLAEDLNLPGNPTEYLDAMTLKAAMQEALKKAGIRYILGEKVHTPEEAVAFCEKNGLSCAVVKPMQSAGSQGLFLCNTVEEVRDAVAKLLTMEDFYGRPITEALVQERIFGTEYIVNTISREGKHRLNTILRYKKEATPEGGYIYDYVEFVTKLEAGHNELVRYALQVADAIHYQNGVIHGEYMLDSKGPVLIEVNCRPMGASMPAEYLDIISGQHETDAVLDALLDPVKFEREAAKPYGLKRKAYLKVIMVPQDIEAEDYPVWEVAKQLRSTYQVSAANGSITEFVKTRDLETNGGIIYLVHDDEKVLEADLQLLRDIEKNTFKLLLNDGMSRKWFTDAEEAEEDFGRILKECDCHGTTLIAGDHKAEIENVQCVTADSLQDATRGFDNVIIAYRKTLTGMKESACLKLIFDTMDLVKPGGRVIIPDSTYNYLSYQEKGAEELMLIKGLTIRDCDMSSRNYVIGIRES